MIERAEAIRFDRIADAGRNLPLRVTVETVAGDEIEVFLKPSGRPELSVSRLASEVLAACIAGHLGLPVCQPLLVNMSPEWIASIPDAGLRAILEDSSPIAFGSKAAGPGWRQWSAEDVLTNGRKTTALGIFAFDAFIENPDRMPRNPNLLVKGDEFRMIDHELSLIVRGRFPAPAPWSQGYLAPMFQQDGHVFASRLRGTNVDLGPLRDGWSSLSDHDLGDYEASIPLEWAEAADAITAALTHLRAVRDRIDDCLGEIGRALA
jgi:hypothetical protein